MSSTVVAGREVEPRDPSRDRTSIADRNRREVVLDASEVHLVEDHVELASRSVPRVRRVPLTGRLLHELAERSVVVEAVERERGSRADPRSTTSSGRPRRASCGRRSRRRTPARATSCPDARARQDHEPTWTDREVVPADDVVADQEPGILLAESRDHLVEQRPGADPIGRALGLCHRVAHAPASHAPTSGRPVCPARHWCFGKVWPRLKPLAGRLPASESGLRSAPADVSGSPRVQPARRRCVVRRQHGRAPGSSQRRPCEAR